MWPLPGQRVGSDRRVVYVDCADEVARASHVEGADWMLLIATRQPDGRVRLTFARRPERD